MHVVVDARPAFAAGIGRYLRAVIPRLAESHPDWSLTLLGSRARLEGAAWASGDNISHLACDAAAFSVAEQLAVPSRIPADATVYWAPNYNIPLMTRVPLAVTIHDVMHLRLREYASTPVRRGYARFMFRQVRRRARAIMCVSRFTRDELDDVVPARGGVAADVIYQGIDAAWSEDGVGAERPAQWPYFVFVGDIKPHKNLPVLLDAFRRITDRFEGRLVLVGRPSASRTAASGVEALATALGERVHRTGEVDDGELRRWVRHAVALVQPSVYEGFGLPPVEAMAAGTPVIAARAGSLPEVCGEAPLYFDPQSPDELAARMQEVIESPALRATLRERGHEQARRYDWDSTARAIASVLQRVSRAH